ncbi:MAG: hypothetical protein ACK5XN_40600 [Bacteroidota bacterium]
MNTKDQLFLTFYRELNLNDNSERLSLYNNLSIHKLYLAYTGKDEAKRQKLPIKVHLKTGLLFVKAFIQLIQLRFKKFNTLWLISDHTHFKQIVGLTNYINTQTSIFVTDKKDFYYNIRKRFNTKHVIYLPTVYLSLVRIPTKNILAHIPESITKEIGETQTVDIIKYHASNYRMLSKLLTPILKNTKQVVVYNDLIMFGRILSELGNRHAIKTIYGMHGLLSDELIEHLHITNEYWVFGNTTKQLLEKKGYLPNQVSVTGAPYLEYYKTHTSPFNLLNALTINPHHKVVLILLSGRGHTTSPKHHELLIQTLHEVIRSTSENSFTYIFKLHKKDNPTYYQSIINDPKIADTVQFYTFESFQEKETIFDWIKLADVILTGASTSAVEAMYLGKPVISIDILGEYEKETEYIRNGATYHAKKTIEIVQLLNQLNENKLPLKNEGVTMASNYFSTSQTFESYFANAKL